MSYTIADSGIQFSSSRARLLLRPFFLLILLLGTTNAWGQVNDGLYYIQLYAKIQNSNPATYEYRYLWPSLTTKREGQPYLSYWNATSFTETINNVKYNLGKAYCSWVVKQKQVTENGNTKTYYMLINVATNQYVVWDKYDNGGNNGGKAVHLETRTTEPSESNDHCFYTFYQNNTNYYIHPDKCTANTRGFNIKGEINANDKLCERSGSPDRGLIQFYNDSYCSITNADLLDAPTISSDVDENGMVTVTDSNGLPEGYNVRYTFKATDDPNDLPDDPTMKYNTEMEAEGFAVSEEGNLKVVIERYGVILTNVATIHVVPPSLEAPKFKVNCDNELEIHTTKVADNIHVYYNYTTDGSEPADPDNNSTPYTAAIPVGSLADGYRFKAIAYEGDTPTGVTPFTYYTNTPQPTVTLSTNEATVSFSGTATIYYTTNGVDPEIGGDGVKSKSGTGSVTINDDADISDAKDIDLRVIAKSDDRGPSCPVVVVKRPKKPTISATDDCNNARKTHTLVFTGTEEGKTYWYALSNGQDQVAPDPESEAYVHYTNPVNLANHPNWDGTSIMVTLHAYAKDSEGNTSVVVSQNYKLKYTDAPTIRVSGGNDNATVTITAVSGATIKYKVDNGAVTSVTSYDVSFTITNQDHTITATAQLGEEGESCERTYQYKGGTHISSLEHIGGSGVYILDSDIENAGSGFSGEFTGTIDGQMHIISGLTSALVNIANGAIIKNVILKDVNISGGDNVGAICNVANGATRIYNCGVLGTINEEPVKDQEGNVVSVNVSGSSSISGSGNVGSIVGQLNGTSRVINCYSYAVIGTGGNCVGGIVGNNTVTNDKPAVSQQTMVMNCMFYGDINDVDINGGGTTGTRNAPIYNGNLITNVGNGAGVSNFNYFRAEARYVQDKRINVYNCALAAETRFLNRFEFFRYLLNSNRALAAWWATGNRDNKDEMMKWVLETANRDLEETDPDPYPFPVLKFVYNENNEVVRYPSVVNIDADHAPTFDDTDKKLPRNKGCSFGTLEVKIRMGSKSGQQIYEAPDGATILGTVEGVRTIYPTITDKDPERFNYNYYKVQLPYYNDYGTKNYTGNRVVTGWKIVDVSDGGTGSYRTGDDAETDGHGNITKTPYNFADRSCSNKDLYSVSGRIFNQGAYFDVPEGVTSITIEPYWAKAVYVSDPYLDKVYDKDMLNAYDVKKLDGTKLYDNGDRGFNGDNSQQVYTSIKDPTTGGKGALSALNPSGTVYDNAIVLVGNFHNYGNNNNPMTSDDKTKPFTLMSVDLDHDNEPDCSYILRYDNRVRVHPVRVDFLNVIGLGMAQKSTGSTGTYNFGIMQPLGWFEATNTSLFRFTQFEYDKLGRDPAPMILHGGVIEQWVTLGERDLSEPEANEVSYYHVGGNVWFKEFHIGAHQDKLEYISPHPPISVSGGDYDIFYLTGYYNTPKTNYSDNAECYINGGRFGKMAGTGMQGIGKVAEQTGNIVWQIDNADIDEFYGGGTNAAHPAEGSITTVISNSRVDQFCGGPKFGDMKEGTTVFTNATNCIFRTFFGAGYGGNSYNRKYPSNLNNQTEDPDWDNWVDEQYEKAYNKNYKGVSTRIDYQYLPMSGNASNVARLFVDYVSFSLATTRAVTSKLTGCTITKKPLGGRLRLFDQCLGKFFGGGNLGKVAGNVNSTLIDCTVEGSAFGAGYSASLPSVNVMVKTDEKWFLKSPHYDKNLGAYLEAELPATKTYNWDPKPVKTLNASNAVDHEKKLLRIQSDDDQLNLGAVTGDVTLTITTTDTGNSVIGELDNASRPMPKEDSGYVFGGGDESSVEGNVNLTIQGNAKVLGGVYGGCNLGSVGTYNVNTTTSIPESSKGGGTTTVLITDNVEVGPDNMKMITDSGWPDDFGHVFAAGKGTVDLLYDDKEINEEDKATEIERIIESEEDDDKQKLQEQLAKLETLAFVNTTDLTISGNAFIKGSVYGGSENGRVLGNTHVTITGNCQIGNGWNDNNDVGVNRRYTSQEWSSESIPECAHWRFDKTDATPWDPYVLEEGKPKAAKDGHTFYGNLFGGGSGYYPYAKRKSSELEALLVKNSGYADGLWLRSAGWVGGNTLVDITGGHILTSVYGGNECTDVAGKCTINMSAGTVGVPRDFSNNLDDRLVTCYVFGAGKGDPRINFNQWTNVGSTEVNISGTARIFGSTFGGGEDGHVIGNAVTNITAGETSNGIQYPYIGTTGKSSADGNVFGGGRGFSENALTAGVVCGNVTININGGTMLGTVFGGGRLAPVGTHIVLAESQYYGKLIDDDYVQVFGDGDPYHMNFGNNGDIYDPDDITASEVKHGHIDVNISGGTIGSSAAGTVSSSIGEVFGGCKGSTNLEKAHLFGLSKETKVIISQGEGKTTHIYNTVYGGGENGNVEGGVSVEINGGTIDKDVYGGGKKASTNILCKDLLTKNYNTTVNLHGGTIKGNVYGGGLGQKGKEAVDEQPAVPAIAAIVGGNVTIKMNEKNGCGDYQNDDSDNCVVQGTIFGCNNVNGTPRGNVEVNIYKTVGNKDPGDFELLAVYGGGNEAAYEPTDAYPSVYSKNTETQEETYTPTYIAYTYEEGYYKPCTYDSDGEAHVNNDGVPISSTTKITALPDVFRANVNIYGCGKTSIGEVYGGGNAAPTPATRVTVNECFEIGSVFGGGNGAGEGNHGANVGYRDYYGQGCDVPDLSYKATRKSNYSYGTGKAETKLYGGTIHQAFGGSNTLGNVREVAFSVLDQQNDCDLTVGEIYGAGNKAFMDAKIELDLGCIAGFKELFGGAYNANVNEDILLRVTSGTFNSVYGGNNVGGSINGTITVEVEETGCHPIIINDGLFGGGKLADYTAPSNHPNSPIVRVKSATKIGNVYGGGFKANVTGNPTVEINMVKGQHTDSTKEKVLGTVNNVFGGGFEGWVKGNTTVLIGTKPGKNAKITGNVFGGGDNADVIGKTDVQIGYDDLKPNTQRTTDQ